jgi:hypothetical protein
MKRVVAVVLALAAVAGVIVFLRTMPYRDYVPGYVARANTRNDLLQLRDAVRAFTKEYGYQPPADPGKLLRILGGAEVDGFNWRKITFMTFRKPEKGHGMIEAPGAFDSRGQWLDGWGSPYVWETQPPKGKLAVWSRLRFERADRETAMKRNFYQVVVE